MATDAEIRARGINFLSPQRYLQNPYQFNEPVVEEGVTEGGGITNTNAFNNSGNEFSVYNPDPNSLPSYRPNYDYRQFSEYGSDPSTADIKQMDMNQEYFNSPPGNPKLQGLMGMIPYVGSFARGAKFLGNQIGPYIPPNRRAIMENELAGKGVMVNNIGQIVQGSGAYDDVSGKNVMAGYNANKMTAETFDKRIAMAKDKMDDEGPYKQPRLDALEAAKANFLKTQKKSNKIVDFEEEEKKKLREKTILGKFMTKRKQKQADKIAQDAKDAQDKINAANAAAVNSPDNYGVQGLQRSGSYGGNATYSGSGSSVSQSGDVTNKDGSDGGNINDEFAKGGRAGYFFGGRVNYKVGGRVGFKDGGLASIL